MTGKRSPGSVTVEAALLMPLILGTILFLVYMGLYGYDRALCTYYCYETSRAIAGGQEEITLGGQETLLKQQAIGLTKVHMTKDCQGEQISVSAQASMEIPFLGKAVEFEETQTACALDQRQFILRCKNTFRRFLGKDG